MIADSCRNSLALSRDIIDASYKFGSHNLNKEEIVINNLVKNCADLMGFKAAEKKQKINVIYNNDTIIATIDKEKIWRILNNLISNAIKFSYENSVIDISVFDDGNKIKVSVKDYGKGIPEKNKAIVFDMFTKAKSPGTQGEKPNGLGLSICLNIAKAHNGNIWFESTEGKGTTFFFEFPKN